MDWPGRYINVWRCGGLSIARLQLKDPLELFVKRSEFIPGSVEWEQQRNKRISDTSVVAERWELSVGPPI